MKILLKIIRILTFALIATNCSEKKETEANRNPVEEKIETSTRNSINPLIAKGQELFEGKGMCVACHKSNVKVIGPSIKDIVKIYKEKGASIAAFINDESKPIVDPSQYEIMKANFTITKAMSAEDRKAIEIYMMRVE
jgi:cytochrome c